MKHDPDCIFCKIVEGKIPSRKVYEDDELYAFDDIHPIAPIHFLVIPKEHIASMAQLEPGHAALMGRMMTKIPQIALDRGCAPYPDGGFRILCNTGRHGRQEVHHLHFHIFGGPPPWQRGQ